MKLAYKLYPKESSSGNPNSKDGINILILHGLFGSSKNWVSIAKKLSLYGDVYTIDLRNHGDSPHSEEHSISLMAEDIDEFIQDHSLQNTILLGHSMGGLVSMLYDLLHPGLLKALIIQDISPRPYPFAYDKEIQSMRIPIDHANTRAEVDGFMSEVLPDAFIRQFLQMSLERKPEGGYFWKLNVEGLSKARHMFENVFLPHMSSGTKSLFIVGGDSTYITDSDRELIRSVFLNSEIETLAGGGHYIHYTHASQFLDRIERFIKGVIA
ncbi:alpha/beta hydrolase [Leptospira kobayashii]|uniref:Alpha/beta hydrolase n=1 Tax=Leptospira kobayashii TaxID=1917830 RepID=A0ABN6KEE1_9LEPT|nr:alpha/beta fold hydrolase [Leptospira kobayashii]BDA77943.1 alpha/beta hydrolase [Leptospira kobayashii]